MFRNTVHPQVNAVSFSPGFCHLIWQMAPGGSILLHTRFSRNMRDKARTSTYNFLFAQAVRVAVVKNAFRALLEGAVPIWNAIQRGGAAAVTSAAPPELLLLRRVNSMLGGAEAKRHEDVKRDMLLSYFEMARREPQHFLPDRPSYPSLRHSHGVLSRYFLCGSILYQVF